MNENLIITVDANIKKSTNEQKCAATSTKVCKNKQKIRALHS